MPPPASGVSGGGCYATEMRMSGGVVSDFGYPGTRGEGVKIGQIFADVLFGWSQREKNIVETCFLQQ